MWRQLYKLLDCLTAVEQFVNMPPHHVVSQTPFQSWCSRVIPPIDLASWSLLATSQPVYGVHSLEILWLLCNKLLVTSLWGKHYITVYGLKFVDWCVGLQWTKLPPNKIKGTIFEKFPMDYKGVKIDYKELEETFAAKVIEKKSEEGKKMLFSFWSSFQRKRRANSFKFWSQKRLKIYPSFSPNTSTFLTRKSRKISKIWTRRNSPSNRWSNCPPSFPPKMTYVDRRLFILDSSPTLTIIFKMVEIWRDWALRNGLHWR